MLDREGAQLPFMPGVAGFIDTAIREQAWRIFYLHSPDGERLVAAGQRLHERDELVFSLVASQLVPWLLVLPALVLAIVWSVGRAMRPVDGLSRQLAARHADDLRPLQSLAIPRELEPLISAMNELMGRFAGVLARERQFTADAAHELRTPLAALAAQWDVVRLAQTNAQREQAGMQLGEGLARMSRLVTQMLELSRLEATGKLPSRQPINWQEVIRHVMSDCMPLADRRRIQMSCEWASAPADAWRLQGDPDMITAMLRNLIDNAVRYARSGTEVTVHVGTHDLSIENAGSTQAASIREVLGQRFRRGEGSSETGSGLGLSIVLRIARLHALTVSVDDRAGGGLRVRVQPLSA
jgi:two-component system sensor histidine kinase QseC